GRDDPAGRGAPAGRPVRPAGCLDGCPGPPLRLGPGGDPLHPRPHPRGEREHRREPLLPICRVAELCPGGGGSHLPPDPAEHPGLHPDLPGDRHGAGHHPGPDPEHALPGPAAGPLPHPHALGGPRRLVLHGLGLDLRLHLQRDQLDPAGGGPPGAPGVVVLVWRSHPGQHRHRHRPRLADAPLLNGGPAGRSELPAPGGAGGGGGGRGRLLPAAPPRGAPLALAGADGGRSLRHGLHRHRLGGGLPPHPGRALQHHPRAGQLRLPAGDLGGGPGAGGGHCRLPLPRAGPGGHRHAPGRPGNGGGALMAVAVVAARQRARRRPGIARVVGRVLLYVLVLCFTLFAVMPFYWMFLTAFKQNRDLSVGATVADHIPWIFNLPPTLEHVRLLFQGTPYLQWLGNTFLVGAVVVAITLITAVPAGYSLARLVGRWGQRLGIAIFLTYLVPPTLLFIPFARLVSVLGLQNSLWALI